MNFLVKSQCNSCQNKWQLRVLFLFLDFLMHHIFYITGRLPLSLMANTIWWYFLKLLKTLSPVSPQIFPLHVHSLTGQVCASQALLFAASFRLCWRFKLSRLAYLQFCYGCSNTFQLPEQEPPEGICLSLNYVWKPSGILWGSPNNNNEHFIRSWVTVLSFQCNTLSSCMYSFHIAKGLLLRADTV